MDDSSLKPKRRDLLLRPKKVQTVLERVNQEMYVQNLDLARTNKTLSLLRTIDKLVQESQGTVQELCDQISHEISESTSYPLVAILASPRHRESSLQIFGLNSRVPIEERIRKDIKALKIDKAQIKWLESPEPTAYTALADIVDRQVSVILNSASHETIKTTGRSLGVKSIYAVKLRARDHLVGVMIIGLVSDAKESTISENDKDLIERLGASVGIALDNKLLLEENIRILHKQQKTNEKLKALDQTKDEFISMASHQLRTPLTSVKGYMSMVLEGDAGKISNPQKELLNQAFVSSQQMVYLIADLLNVSRLKTGKFVIEAAPTNLSDVVEGEISQLKELAKSKKLSLDFKKPKKFPVLMLDETKIRQVIMNFADNAIYYTPSGGKIDIELKEDKSNIYFMVKDNGLGVPKNEQSRLFTKFYRAKNARKARPDGTGLGLFMAKKVINAQGGGLLFKSVEGKGSTFGFTFKKAKLTPKKTKQ
jgi:signal transduction histidine kinase